jgi:TIR domain
MTVQHAGGHDPAPNGWGHITVGPDGVVALSAANKALRLAPSCSPSLCGMALSRAERFRLKSGIIEAFGSDGWSFNRVSLLFAEYGLAQPDDGFSYESSLVDALSPIADKDLIELYSVVTGVDTAQVQDAIDHADPGNWKPGYVRLFISHSAKHKAFVGKVADRLAVSGIHGFVAHDTMAYDLAWQGQIEQALRTMDVFVAIIHPEFNTSPWCHQEIGWASGRRVPLRVIRAGSDPVGFPGSVQWPAVPDGDDAQAAEVITSWVSELPEIGDSLSAGLFQALRDAGDFVTAGAAASRIATLGQLSEAQWRKLDEIVLENDQVHGGVLSYRALSPFYSANGRTYPPEKRPVPAPTSAPRAVGDEPPF